MASRLISQAMSTWDLICKKFRPRSAISPFTIVFSKACFPGVSKGVIMWEWVKPPERDSLLKTLQKKKLLK